jgi:hypothetical protein
MLLSIHHSSHLSSIYHSIQAICFFLGSCIPEVWVSSRVFQKSGSDNIGERSVFCTNRRIVRLYLTGGQVTGANGNLLQQAI